MANTQSEGVLVSILLEECKALRSEMNYELQLRQQFFHRTSRRLVPYRSRFSRQSVQDAYCFF